MKAIDEERERGRARKSGMAEGGRGGNETAAYAKRRRETRTRESRGEKLRDGEKRRDRHCRINTLALSMVSPFSLSLSLSLFLPLRFFNRVLVPPMEEGGRSALGRVRGSGRVFHGPVSPLEFVRSRYYAPTSPLEHGPKFRERPLVARILLPD